jgi:uncharacterized membrane protein YccC
MADQRNVVVLHHGTPARKNAAAFMGMEPEIHDLCRMVDLTLHTFLDELKKPIADDGSSCLQVLLEDLQQRARRLRSRYSSDDRHDDAAAALRAAMKIGLAACLLLATTVAGA